MKSILIKNAELKSFSAYMLRDENNKTETPCLSLTYIIKDTVGNIYERTYPEIHIPIPMFDIPKLKEELVSFGGCYVPPAKTYMIPSDDQWRLGEVVYTDRLIKRATKKMTLSEVENELGYKVELVSEEEK